MRLVGYASQPSARAGDVVELKVSSHHKSFSVDLVRLRQPGSPLHAQPLVEEVISDVAAAVPGRLQHTASGSYVQSEIVGTLNELSVSVWFAPTLPEEDDPRPLVTIGPLCVAVDQNGLILREGAGEVARLDVEIAPRTWAFVSVVIDAAGAVKFTLYRPGRRALSVDAVVSPLSLESPLLTLGGDGSGRPGSRGGFNGRIARPCIATVAWAPSVGKSLADGADPCDLLDVSQLSALDLGAAPESPAVSDRGELTRGGTVHHLPRRGIPGPFWEGDTARFRDQPDQFDAIHLHEDDLADAGWKTDLVWTVPDDLASGVYALRIRAGDDVDRIPIVVTPAAQRNRLLVVLPTWTYLAYSCWRSYAEFEEDRAIRLGEHRGVDPRDVWMMDHPEFGLSMYDDHRDGSGVSHASWRRPIVSFRPDYFTPATRGFRHFAADLLLLQWLDAAGYDYDVVTDDEVDREGKEMLGHYEVVMTGSHPEYVSARIYDSLLDYTASGGRLMYLGGNGYYWVTAREPAHPFALEIRRGHAGEIRWYSDPGEEYLQSTGELGGLWRNRRRAPNILTGVGFTAHGLARGAGFERSVRSAEDDVRWVFEGVDALPGQVFGLGGPGLGGAAGDELDRADFALGTPDWAVVLASSVDHSPTMILTPEERYLGYRRPGEGVDPKIRADLVLFDRPGGGAVFSVGSMTWIAAMALDDGNEVSRITDNVIRRFLETAGPFTGSS